MDNKIQLFKHFLAAIAYRTQKAIKGAPPDFGSFRVSDKMRTPQELIRHMDSVLGYARTFFIGGKYRAPEFSSFEEVIHHFHEILEDLGRQIESETEWKDITPERLLQGPLSDAMTHAGQLAMLRRLHGSPVPPENFVFADISADNLGPDQSPPVSPDKEWPERG